MVKEAWLVYLTVLQQDFLAAGSSSKEFQQTCVKT